MTGTRGPQRGIHIFLRQYEAKPSAALLEKRFFVRFRDVLHSAQRVNRSRVWPASNGQNV